MDQRLQRRKGESRFEHHKRLVNGKLKNKSLGDVGYSQLAVELYGRKYAPDVARRMMYGTAKTLDLIDEDGIDGSSSQTDLIEIKLERQKLNDLRTDVRRQIRELSRWQSIQELVDDAVLSGSLNELCIDEPRVVSTAQDGTHLLISLNDIHYGAMISNRWNVYSPEMFVRYLAQYLIKIEEIQKRHGARDCTVWANGDLISGNIHHTIQLSNRENLVEQVIGVSEMIALFLSHLAGIFDTVHFVSVAGNHSRIADKNKEVVGERLDNLVEVYVRARLHDLSNVLFETKGKIDDTLYVITVNGKKFCGVHGDFDAATNGNIQALNALCGGGLYGVLTGHKHHNEYNIVQGVRVYMAGSFMGMDEYCVKKRIYGEPQQSVLVVGNDGVECVYDVVFDNKKENRGEVEDV